MPCAIMHTFLNASGSIILSSVDGFLAKLVG